MKAVVTESSALGTTQMPIFVKFSRSMLTAFAPFLFHSRVYIAFPDAHPCFSLDYAALWVFFMLFLSMLEQQGLVGRASL